MDSLKPLQIDMKGLSQGDNQCEFDLDDSFFAALEAAEVKKGRLHAVLTIHRQGDLFDVDIHCKGFVIVPCDLCLEEMEQPIDADDHIVVQFGDDYAEDDDLITLREDEGILDTAWPIYQSIALNIPLRHVHAPGKCNPVMMRILKEHSAARSGDGDVEKTVDSRWEALKNLRITN